MSTQLYTVTLTDLGTYRITVAAESSKDAEGVAKTVLYEEATRLPKGMARCVLQATRTGSPTTAGAFD